MKVYAINGSPRKNRNTATLLNKALEGAASQGADTEMIHIYDLNFKGCRSCFACREKEGKSFGTCALKDDLTPLLEKLKEADALILGSPIYYGSITGEMKSFMERFCFPYMQYRTEQSILFERDIPTGFIYTLNATEEQVAQFGHTGAISVNEIFLKMLTGHHESLYAYNTFQFDDYDRYVTDGMNKEEKARQRQEQFPRDCEEAFSLGARFAKGEVTFQRLNPYAQVMENAS